jgi:hypothetical protein
VTDLEACRRLTRHHLVNRQLVGTGEASPSSTPKARHGVLKLYELTQEEPWIRLDRARTLADRVLGEGQVMVAGALGFLRSLRPPGLGGNSSPPDGEE